MAQTPAKKKEQEPPTPPAVQISHSERFTAMVLREFGSNVAGTLDVSEQQKRLIQGYFIGIDRALKAAEEKRKPDNPVPYTWDNVNLVDLALDVVTYARLGLDMRQDNHLFAIAYKNNRTQKYDITLMKGYVGIQYIAEKYALEPPAAVTTELVFSTDAFVVHKKSVTNPVETYEFEITNPFDRGELVGAFAYIEYADKTKNKLVLMSKRDIEKRKPQYASKQFWGDGNGAGWYEEMCMKTLKREVYSSKHIPLDPAKIDEDYQLMRLRDARYAELEAQAEIDANANLTPIDVDGTPLPEASAPVALPAADGGSVVLDTDKGTGEIKSAATVPAGQAAQGGQQTLGPTF